MSDPFWNRTPYLVVDEPVPDCFKQLEHRLSELGCAPLRSVEYEQAEQTCWRMGNVEFYAEAIRHELSRSPIDQAAVRRRPAEFSDFMIEATAACLEQEGLDGSVYLASYERAMDQRGGAYLGDPLYYSGLLPPLTPQAAATSGYRTVLRPHPPAGFDIPELPEGYADALLGDESQMVQIEIPGFGVIGAPSGGCVASSAALLFGSVVDWLLADQFAMSGIRQLSDEALESPEVRAVAEAYAACMRDSGYDVENPAQAAQAARDRWVPAGTEAEAPGQDEIEMAVVDAECQAAHPVLRVAEEKTIDLASEWIADNATAILAAAAAQRRALALVLGDEGGD